jgi:peptidyl-prolyl cis-trans isomerase SurA
MKTLCISFLILISFLSCAQETKSITISEESKKEAKEKIEGYRQQVLKGESMSTIAALYSDDPGSKKTGGAYYNIARGQFVPEFETVAFNLQPGEISEVFETQYGFHFVQLIARRGDVIDVRHVLVVPK